MDGPIVACHPDGRVVYRASALGGCDLALLAARLEYEAIPPPPNLQKVYDKGHDIEPLIIAELRSIGWQVDSAQREVVLPLSSKISVVGHIDAERFQVPSGIVEVKSQSELEWRRFEAIGWDGGFFPKYKWQVSAYMLAMNLPLYMVRAKRGVDGGFDDYKIEVIAEPFYSLEDIRRRVLRIEALAASGVASAACTSDYGCPYFYLHEELDREFVTDVAVEVLAKEYVTAGLDEKVAKGKKETSRAALRAAIEGNKIETENGTKVTFYMQKNPPAVDRGRLEGFLKLQGTQMADFQTQTESERMRVTLPKDGEDGRREGTD